MILNTDVEKPSVGMGVYYLNPRTHIAAMCRAMVTKVTSKEITLVIPQLSGKGWKPEDKKNLRTFTWRKSHRKWAEKGDGLALCCVLFPDIETEQDILGTFEALRDC